MEKQKDFIIIIFFIGLILVSWKMIATTTKLDKELSDMNLQHQIYQERLQECKKYPLFEQVVSEVGGRKYDLVKYNCVDFSKDIVKGLEEIGIKSNIATSRDRSHAWVVVWIEATTGEFVRPEEALGLLELRDEEMKVICK